MANIKFINSRNLQLVGQMNEVHSDRVVVLAHGFTNDKSSNGRFEKMAKALNHDGFDTLALDFSGSGESDDGALTAGNQYDDLHGVINTLVDKAYKQIILLGNSFGSLACLKNYRPEIKTMILIGALTGPMKYQWDEFFTKEALEAINSKGFVNLNNSRRHLITKETLMDFESIDQRALIEKIQCPVLLIHGNHKDDEEELQLLSHSLKAIERLPKASKLEVIEGGKHGFHKQWDEVIELTRDWLGLFKPTDWV